MSDMSSALARFSLSFYTKDRFDEYRNILESAVLNGYSIISLDHFAKLVNSESILPSKAYLVLRHDIDTDPDTALIFSSIETNLQVSATYYFRIKTWNDAVVAKLANLNHSIGYHNEELSDYAKKQHFKNPDKLLDRISDIQDLFLSRISFLRERSGLPINHTASHGDFVNRKLFIKNNLILLDSSFRMKAGIEFEAYDANIQNAYGIHVSDRPAPSHFYPRHPLDLITKRKSFCLLTHPRWWKPNFRESIKTDVLRIWEQINW